MNRNSNTLPLVQRWFKPCMIIGSQANIDIVKGRGGGGGGIWECFNSLRINFYMHDFSVLV